MRALRAGEGAGVLLSPSLHPSHPPAPPRTRAPSQGAVGAGGLGDLAIRYGYYRFETNVMIWCVIIMFVLVQATQWLGDGLVRLFDKRV